MIKVKICGITNLEDACAAAEAGADLLGFVFYPPSPRYVSPVTANGIISELRRVYDVRTVGVFANAAVEEMREIVRQCGVDLVQLSGDEPAFVVQDLCPSAFKALRPRDPADLDRLLNCYRPAARDKPPAFLIDAFSQKLFGGTGERADWEQAGELAARFPVLLAGGLSRDNVAEAVKAVHPWGVDVSSGVERAPGLKDLEKVRQFIERAKGDAE